MKITLAIIDGNGDGKTVDLLPYADRHVYEDLEIMGVDVNEGVKKLILERTQEAIANVNFKENKVR